MYHFVSEFGINSARHKFSKITAMKNLLASDMLVEFLSGCKMLLL